MSRPTLLASLMSLLATAATSTLGCGDSFCDCYDGSDGLMITTDTPVTSVTLSGAACRKARFRCLPEALDSNIHGDCESIQVVPNAEGGCVVDLTIGGVAMQLERQMRRSTCDCYGTYYTEASQRGEIDLREKPDAGILDYP